ncbi:tRNA U55 pseudouridine synthase TruB [Dysgonomonas sp. PH5-45]|nr:tRNA U55 pseudouridine synthase TruB [Dysgonomonas sp. PH5-45]
MSDNINAITTHLGYKLNAYGHIVTCHRNNSINFSINEWIKFEKKI